MTAQQELMSELERVISHNTANKQAETLSRVADLFILHSVQYSDDQIDLFDIVFARLVVDIETEARALLAHRLATIPNAPAAIIRTLAYDEEIVVAGPVLTYSPRLDEPVLIDIARTKGQRHLLAISRRKYLGEPVTDMLVGRGDREVALCIAKNPGAKLSDYGFSTLIAHAENDDGLAECIGSRQDIPRHHFLRLLSKASETVRIKLEAINPQGQHEIDRVIGQVVEQIANRIQAETVAVSRNYAVAQSLVGALHAAGNLSDSEIEGFAKDGKFELTTAAIAALCDLKIATVEQAMIQDRPELILIFMKAGGLSWRTAKAILKLRSEDDGISSMEIERCLAIFERLKRLTAEQALQFHRRRGRAAMTRPH